jgi:hypothetical protein
MAVGAVLLNAIATAIVGYAIVGALVFFWVVL